MITMYSRDDREMSQLENQMYNIGGYSNPYVNNPYVNNNPYVQQQPMYQYQQPQQYQSLGGMGSYYSGNSYYNPYMERIRQEEERIAYERRYSNQRESDIQLLKMHLSQVYGRPATYEEAAKEYDKRFEVDECKQEEYEELSNLANYQQTVNDPGVELVTEEHNRLVHSYNEVVSEYNNVNSMLDYFDKVEDNLREERRRKLVISQRNLSGTYDSNDFASILDIHNNASLNYTDAFGVRREVDISDQVIGLPPSISMEYQEKKNRFIAEITKRDIGGGFRG